MKRKLTWKQAWMKLHRAWKKPVKTMFPELGITFWRNQAARFDGLGLSSGLCDQITSLYFADLIDDKMLIKMRYVVRRLKTSHYTSEGQTPWKFPFDDRGSKQRAAFCLRMAKKKEPK